MNAKLLLVSISFLVLIFACTKEDEHLMDIRLDLPEESFDYTTAFEDFYNTNPFEFNNAPFDNSLTDAGATLGRVLFYDRRMSKSNLVSCSSCHAQNLAFSDDKPFSTGFVNGDTKRNSLPINNLSTKGAFFWDQRAETLEEQVLMPVTDHIEMGIEGLDELVEKLNMIDYYPSLFTHAFGTEEITSENVSMALAQFLRSMISRSSKFDEGQLNNFANFSLTEKNGKDLFFQLPCGSCHNGTNFSGWGTANIGLDMEYADNGVSEWNEFFPQGNFAIPSLRNIAKTGPYMHDGRFETLREVIEHYANGVQPHIDLDGRLREGSWVTIDNPFVIPSFGQGDPFTLNLSNDDMDDLVAFFNTLTDQELTTSVKFSDPFVFE